MKTHRWAIYDQDGYGGGTANMGSGSDGFTFL